MVKLSDPQFADDVMRNVDQRIDLAFERLGLRLRFGPVMAVDTGSRKCSLLIGGQASPGYAYGEHVPLVGDLVAGAETSDGQRVVLRIYGRDIEDEVMVEDVVIYPSVGSDQNDWAPEGIETATRIMVAVTGATRTITGIDDTSFTVGRRIIIMTKTNALVLAHGSGLSASGNSFACPGAVDLTIRQGGGVEIVYDSTFNNVSPFRVVAP